MLGRNIFFGPRPVVLPRAGRPPLGRLYVAACHSANMQRTKNPKEKRLKLSFQSDILFYRKRSQRLSPLVNIQYFSPCGPKRMSHRSMNHLLQRL